MRDVDLLSVTRKDPSSCKLPVLQPIYNWSPSTVGSTSFSFIVGGICGLIAGGFVEGISRQLDDAP